MVPLKDHAFDTASREQGHHISSWVQLLGLPSAFTLYILHMDAAMAALTISGGPASAVFTTPAMHESSLPHVGVSFTHFYTVLHACQWPGQEGGLCNLLQKKTWAHRAGREPHCTLLAAQMDVTPCCPGAHSLSCVFAWYGKDCV